MKKTLYTIIILSFSALALCSCQKMDQESTGYEDLVTSRMYGSSCTHSNMEYVAALEPDEYSYGCVEHYCCPDCGACFSDAEGRNVLDDITVWGSSINLNCAEFVDNLTAEYESLFADEESNSFIAASEILNLLKSAALNELGEVWNKLLDVYHKATGPKPAPTMDDYLLGIMNQLGNIENAINAVSSTLKELDEKNMMVERERGIFYLANTTHPSFMAVMKQLEQVSIPSEITDEKKEKVRKIVNDWYDKGVFNGTDYKDCYVTICDLMHFFNGYIASRSFPEMYDRIVNNSTPWKHEQEQMKYMIRISDVMNLTEAYFMMALYLNFNVDKTSAEKLKLLNSELQAYHKVIEANPVPAPEKGYFEWTWPGKTKLDEYYIFNEMWKYPNLDDAYNRVVNEKWSWQWGQPLELMWGQSHDGKHVELTREENMVIWNYYKSSARISSYYDAIVKLGMKGVVSFKEKGRIVCYDNHKWEISIDKGRYKNKFWGYYRAFRFVGDNPGWINFDNVVSPDGFTFFQAPFRTGLEWALDEIEHKWPTNIIYGPGKSDGLVFEAVTRDASKPSRKQ